MASNNRRSNWMSKIDQEVFKQIRTVIKRKNVVQMGPPAPIERSLDDPYSLNVHYRKDGWRCPIFDEIIAESTAEEESNKSEERVVLNENQQGSRDRSRSPSNDRRRRSRSSSRPRRSEGRQLYRRSRERQTPLRPGEYRPRRRSSSRGRRSRSRSPRNRPRSGSKSYEKPSTSRRSRSLSREKHSKALHKRSRSRSPYKRVSKERDRLRGKSRERRRSRSPRDRYDKGKDRYDRRGHERRKSSDRYYRERSRSPRGGSDRRWSRDRSPHPPIVTFSSKRKAEDYKRRKSRTRSKSPQPIPGYPYFFEGHEFWYPPMRPGFIPGMYPQPFPRIPGPMMMPRFPGGPMMPYPPGPRGRLPVYNHRSKVKPLNPSNSGGNSSSNENVPNNEAGNDPAPLIEEAQDNDNSNNAEDTADVKNVLDERDKLMD